MYELKEIGKVFTSKFVRTGPSSYKKRNLPGRGLTEVEKHWVREENNHIPVGKLSKISPH